MAKVILKEGSLHGQEAVEFIAAMATLDSLLSASETIVYPALDPPVATSPMGRAHKASTRDANEQARLLLASSEDHLGTILMLVQLNVLPMFSLFSLLRPAAEADVRMAYLLDPAIDERLRLARGLNVRLESLVEQDKVKPDAALLASRTWSQEYRGDVWSARQPDSFRRDIAGMYSR